MGKHRHESCHKDEKDEKKSQFSLPIYLRGEGLSLQNNEPAPFPGGVLVAKCRLFNEKYEMIGTAQSTVVDAGVNVVHEWKLTDGSHLEIKVPNTQAFTLSGPLDQKFADAFPSTSQFVGQNAGYVIFAGNYFKNNTDIISWKGTGIFKHAAYEESRCTYVTFPGQFEDFAPILECLGCMWYITEAPLFGKH